MRCQRDLGDLLDTASLLADDPRLQDLVLVCGDGRVAGSRLLFALALPILDPVRAALQEGGLVLLPDMAAASVQKQLRAFMSGRWGRLLPDSAQTTCHMSDTDGAPGTVTEDLKSSQLAEDLRLSESEDDLNKDVRNIEQVEPRVKGNVKRIVDRMMMGRRCKVMVKKLSPQTVSSNISFGQRLQLLTIVPEPGTRGRMKRVEAKRKWQIGKVLRSWVGAMGRSEEAASLQFSCGGAILRGYERVGELLSSLITVGDTIK
jgi:hypothetical protein